MHKQKGVVEVVLVLLLVVALGATRKIIFKTTFGKKAIAYVIKKDNAFYLISTGMIGDLDISQSRHLETHNQILSTFKFLN